MRSLLSCYLVALSTCLILFTVLLLRNAPENPNSIKGPGACVHVHTPTQDDLKRLLLVWQIKKENLTKVLTPSNSTHLAPQPAHNESGLVLFDQDNTGQDNRTTLQKTTTSNNSTSSGVVAVVAAVNPSANNSTSLQSQFLGFVQTLTSQPVPTEFLELHKRGVVLYPQQPCSIPTTSALPHHRHHKNLRVVLTANDPSLHLADMQNSAFSPTMRHSLSYSGLETEPALFPTNSSCAVVGSSPRLLDDQHGSLIDSFDVVFRINMAPTKGFSRHTGHKRTVEVGAAATLINRWLRTGHGPIYTKQVPPQTVRRTAAGYWVQVAVKTSYEPPQVPRVPGTNGEFALIPGITSGDLKDYTQARGSSLLSQGDPRKTKFLAMSPDLRRVGNRLYCHLSNNGSIWPHSNRANNGNGIAPTSGFMAIIFALSTCREVNVFGFGQSAQHAEWFPKAAASTGSSHYFDASSLYGISADDGNYGGHWYTLERYLLHRLAQENLIKWY